MPSLKRRQILSFFTEEWGMQIRTFIHHALSLAVALALVGGTTSEIHAASAAPAAKPSSAPQVVSGAAPAATQVVVPQGTILIVATKHGYNSYGASAGTKVMYELSQDLVVNGYLVAKAGDAAEGSVLNAQQGKNSFFEMQAANLRVSIDKIYTYCGDTLDIDFVRSEFRQRQGVFGSHKDVEIIKGQKYQAPTEH
ncbi:MAG: hypothetical protein ACXVAS_18420, partial [Vulcanimicrobiaceae bacterium]